MMRGFFITACALSLVYIVSTFMLAQQVDDARDAAWDQTYNSYIDDDYTSEYSYDDNNYYLEEAESDTRTAGVTSVMYMIMSAGVFVLALMKIKTKTMKVISIIGLSLAGLFLLWGFLPMATPDAVSFDEVGPAFGLAGIALMGLHVVGVVHAFKTNT